MKSLDNSIEDIKPTNRPTVFLQKQISYLGLNIRSALISSSRSFMLPIKFDVTQWLRDETN
jgi:hypothetical protein